MANNCCYDLLAKGSEYGIKKLYSFLKQVGTPESKFHRVWDFFPYDDDEIIEDMGYGTFQLGGCGNCAWSLDHTFMHNELIEDPRPFIVYLSEFYGLTIELVSEEIGLGFSEHIIIDKGDICVNESRDIYSVEKDGEYTVVGTYEMTI